MLQSKLSSSHTATGTGTVTITLAAAGQGSANVIHGIHISSDDSTFTGVLTVKDGTTTCYTMYITAGGMGPLPFPIPLRGSHNTALVVSCTNPGLHNLSINLVGVTTE